MHPSVYEWIDEMAKITKPDKIVWIDGSEKEKQRLIKEALESGELMELKPRKASWMLSSQNSSERCCKG